MTVPYAPIKIHELSTKLNDPSFEIHLLLHVSSAIALHEQIAENEEIEKAFEVDSPSFMAAYRRSPYYRHIFFQNAPAVDSIRMQKCLAMYAHEEEQEKGAGRKLLLKYISTGYKRIVDYVERNDILSVHAVFGMYINKSHNQPSETQNTNIGAILMFLGYEDKQIIVDPLLKNVLYNMRVYSFDGGKKDREFMKVREDEQLMILRKLQTAFGFKIPKESNLDALLSMHEEHLSKTMLTSKEKKELVSKLNFDILYKKGLYKWWKSITSVFRLNEINDMNFNVFPITREELIDIGTLFEVYFRKGRLTEEDYEAFLCFSLSNLMMTKHYNVLRDAHQELFEEKSGMHDALKTEAENTQIDSLQQKNNAQARQIAEQNELLLRQKAELEELRRQVKHYQTQEKEHEHLKKEVVALRDFAFQQEEIENTIEEQSLQTAISSLSDKKIAIIGGHDNWRRRIKEFLPNARTVSPEELHIDLSFIHQMNLVCFVATHNNHSQYERVMKTLEQKDTRFMYVNQKNLEIVLSQMAEQLKS